VIGALRTRNDERLYWLAIGTLIALAWVIAFVLGTSEYARYAGHSTLAEHVHAGASGAHALPGALAVAAFVGGWTAMTVAMMLPTALPLITLFRVTVGRRPERAGLVARLIGGYLGVWALFGVLLYLVDAGIHRAVAGVPLLAAATGYLLPVVLLAAGAYQFTPLKDRCLQECRSPLTFIAGHWTGVAPAREAVRLGARHGVFCLGCCWALMLLMFALGVAHLPGMLVLGAVMAAEKSMPWGRRLVAPVGVVFVLSAAALAAQEVLARLR
jgi:predicted metal-binding membrane protein